MHKQVLTFNIHLKLIRLKKHYKVNMYVVSKAKMLTAVTCTKIHSKKYCTYRLSYCIYCNFKDKTLTWINFGNIMLCDNKH